MAQYISHNQRFLALLYGTFHLWIERLHVNALFKGSKIPLGAFAAAMKYREIAHKSVAAYCCLSYISHDSNSFSLHLGTISTSKPNVITNMDIEE